MCILLISYFQTCKLTFGSWTYTSSQLLLEGWGAHGSEEAHGEYDMR